MNGAASSERAAKRIKVEEDETIPKAEGIPEQDVTIKANKVNGNGEAEEVLKQEEEEAEQLEDEKYGIYEIEASEAVPPSGDLYLDTVNSVFFLSMRMERLS